MTLLRSLPSLVTCLAIAAIAVVYVRDSMRAKPVVAPAPVPVKAPAPPPAPPPLPVSADLADVAAAYHGSAADRLNDLAVRLRAGHGATRAEVEATFAAYERPYRFALARILDEACGPDGAIGHPAEIANAYDTAARAIRKAAGPTP